ncbi:hypothetical protein GJ496_000118 [Pomphorhynchus laevis]|nr:hypothetical protein GJ496_000118 [Pomphorhynchus laevis]
MDRNLVSRVHGCIKRSLIKNERSVTDAREVMNMLQMQHLEYKRYRVQPLLKAIERILHNYNNQAKTCLDKNKDHEMRPAVRGNEEASMKKENLSSTRLQTQNQNGSLKRHRYNQSLCITSHETLTDDFICECSFKSKVLEETNHIFKRRGEDSYHSLSKDVLLISGYSGSGKTQLVKWLCKYYQIDMVRIDSVLEFEDNFQQIIAMLNSRIVCFIEDIDDSGLSTHVASSMHNIKPVRLFKRLIEHLKLVNDSNRAIVVCTCRDVGSLNETVRMAVDYEIKILNPEKKCREAILRSLLPPYSHTWLKDVAELTTSYLPSHLRKLCTLAIQKSESRHENDKQGNMIELIDFLEALKCHSTVYNSGNMLTSQCTNSVQVPETTWEDVGSLDNVRKILDDHLLFQCRCSDLVKEGRINKLGMLSEPSGILLVGPPGCGKTLLGKAVANELSVNFLAVNGPELLNMYVGESERSVRRLFQEASNFKPCIIFFDEIDALCTRRQDGHGSYDGPLVLNQLLVEMDGIRGRSGVYLMAATNMLEVIDPAITRPGRFGTLVYIGLPDCKGRHDILKKMLRKCSQNVSPECLNSVVSETKNYTGADLKNLVSIAARHALISRPEFTDELINEDLLYALKQTKPSLSEEDIKSYEQKQKHRCCNYNNNG